MTNSAIFNDRNVYILGAGFSRDAGLPLVAEFTNRMRDALEWFELNGDETEANAIRKVLDFRRQASSAAERVPLNLENIEEIFSLAAARGDVELDRSAALAIAATLDYAAGSISPPQEQLFVTQGTPARPRWHSPQKVIVGAEERVRWTCPKYHVYALSMAGFPDERESSRRDTIITFNYDTLVEDALTDLSIPFSYGFERQTPIFHESAHCDRRPATEAPGVIQVLKIHGSVNSAMTPGAKDLTVFGSYEDVRSNELSPFLIPPTWRKEQAGQLSDIWDAAVRAINSATRIAIIGYSIPPTDQHFKYLLAAGLSGNNSLRKVFFVNPDASALAGRVSTVLREDLRPQLVELVTAGTQDILAAYRSELHRQPPPNGRWSR